MHKYVVHINTQCLRYHMRVNDSESHVSLKTNQHMHLVLAHLWQSMIQFSIPSTSWCDRRRLTGRTMWCYCRQAELHPGLSMCISHVLSISDSSFSSRLLILSQQITHLHTYTHTYIHTHTQMDTHNTCTHTRTPASKPAHWMSVLHTA